MNERDYPVFNIGDEVSPIKKYRALTKGSPYIVLECYNPYPYLTNSNVLKIKVLTDKGFVGEYATYHFQKTIRQLLIELRSNKLDSILK